MPMQMENYTLAQFSDFRQLKEYVNALKPDVVILFHAPFFLSKISPFIDEIKKLTRIVVYVPVEGFPLTIDLSFLDKADLILTPSRFSQECLAKEGYKAEVLYHGVDQNVFRPIKSIEKKYLEEEIFKIGTVASLNWRKQLTAIIDAYALAISKGMKNTEYYLVASTYDSTPWMPDINTYTQKLGIKIKLSKTAYLNLPVTAQTMTSFYNQLHLHILPTSESFGLPTLEAMACGTVPVVIKHGASPEIVADCGIYVETEGWFATSMGRFALVKIEDLANKITWASQNREALMRLAKKAVKKAKLFNWNKAVTQLHELMHHL